MARLRRSPCANTVLVEKMRIDQPLPFALTICTFAGIALYALHPKPSVQLEGEIAMLEPSVALRRLDAAADTEIQRNLALTHAALAIEAGEFDVAASVLRKLRDAGQDTVEIEMMLANAGRLSGDPASQMGHLAAAYDLAPSSALRQQLGLAYRINRFPAQERALLLAIDSRDLTSYEASRLADLLRQARQFDVLENLYRKRADGDGPDADEAKQLFIIHLLENGRSAEAQIQALRWFEASRRDQHMLQTAIPAFVNWGALDEAMSLALSSLRAAPKTSYQLIAVFLDSGQQNSAITFQQAWLEKIPTVPSEAWPTLLDIAERTGNLAGLRIALSKTPADALPTAQLSKALLQFLRYQGVQALYPFSEYLRKDVLKDQPLIGAAWAAGQSNQIEAAAFLIESAKGEMTDWDWMIWGNIAKSLQGSSAYQILLANAPAESRARSVLLSAFMAKREQPEQAVSEERGD